MPDGSRSASTSGVLSLVRSISTVGLVTGLSRFAGLGRDMLLAAVLGSGLVAEAFVLGLRVANMLRRFLADQALLSAFVPLYGRLRNRPLLAARFAGQAFWGIVVLAAVPVGLLIVWMPQVIGVLAPGFGDDPVRYEFAVVAARIMMAYLVGMAVMSLFSGMLQVHHHFAVPAACPLAFNACIIGALFVIHDQQMLPIVALNVLSWAVLFSALLQVGWLVCWMVGRGINGTIHPRIWAGSWRRIRLMVRRLGVIGVSASATQINLLVDQAIASTLAVGSLVHLYYADRLVQLPLALVGISSATVLLARLSRIDANRSGELWFTMVLVAGLTIPAAMALFVGSHSLVGVLFQRGAFGAAETDVTARTLQALALGLPAFALLKPLQALIHAAGRPRVLLPIFVMSIPINALLGVGLSQTLGVEGLALATTGTAWLVLGGSIWRLNRVDLWPAMMIPWWLLWRTGWCLAGCATLLLLGTRAGVVADRPLPTLALAGVALILYAGGWWRWCLALWVGRR